MLKKISVLTLCLFMLGLGFSALAQDSNQRLKFTVVALSKESDIRQSFENELVKNLKANQYNAVASHLLIADLPDFSKPDVYKRLREKGIQGVLLLMPIDVGEQASIKSAQQRVWSTTYDSIEAFVNGYRGGNFNTQAVVQVSGFLITDNKSSNFWQGVIWLDDTVKTRQEGIEKLSGLVLSNLNASRAYLRKLLGLEPLN
jgi:hypothetical protein